MTRESIQLVMHLQFRFITCPHCKVGQHSSQTLLQHLWNKACREELPPCGGKFKIDFFSEHKTLKSWRKCLLTTCECRICNQWAGQLQRTACHSCPSTWTDVRRDQVLKAWSRSMWLASLVGLGRLRHILSCLFPQCLRHQLRAT